MIHCFFHSADLDGHCAGAIVKYKFPEAVMHEIDYGQKFQLKDIDLKKDTIIFVDFCLQPISEIVELFKIFNNRLIIIDHHISTIRDLEKEGLEQKIPGICINNLAGCELTWAYYFPTEEIPECVRLLGRYDVWDLEYPNVLPFQFGMRLNDTLPVTENSMIMWKNYFNKKSFNNLIAETIEKGKIILKYQKQENEKYIKSNAFEADFQGYKAICVNKLLTNSQLFDSVWDEKKYDLMITFGIKNNGMWAMSFYTTKENIDCSKIAKSFGGGGHVQAAGCNLKRLPKELVQQIHFRQDKL